VTAKPPASSGIIPWFAPQDYASHWVLDSTLPRSFDEWLASAEASAGPPHSQQRVVIRPAEFGRWCVAERRRPDAAARADFALQARGRSMPRG
jgi:hypothetical protein